MPENPIEAAAKELEKWVGILKAMLERQESEAAAKLTKEQHEALLAKIDELKQDGKEVDPTRLSEAKKAMESIKDKTATLEKAIADLPPELRQQLEGPMSELTNAVDIGQGTTGWALDCAKGADGGFLNMQNDNKPAVNGLGQQGAQAVQAQGFKA